MKSRIGTNNNNNYYYNNRVPSAAAGLKTKRSSNQRRHTQWREKRRPFTLMLVGTNKQKNTSKYLDQYMYGKI